MSALRSHPDIEDTNFSDRGHARTEADKARALVQKLHAAGRRSTAELLHELRRAFPDAPLAVRVQALAVLPAL